MITCVPGNETSSPRGHYTFVEYTRDSVVVPRPTMTGVKIETRTRGDHTPPHPEQYRPIAPATQPDR